MRIRAKRSGQSWWARRRAEKLKLKKQAELDKHELELKEIELAKARDEYVEEKTARVEAKKESRAEAARAAFVARWRGIRDRIAEDRPLLAATIMSGVCLVIEFVGQIMFYGALPWPTPLLFMPVLLAILVTGATWTFAINAAYLAAKRMSGAADIRKMWYWASAAAVMNGYHGWVTLREPTAGVILGAASLVGPYIWHRYVTLRKITKSGRTAEQIRAALLRRLFHPILWKRATDLWAAADGAMTTSAAWRLTWVQAKGAAPGMPSTSHLTPARNGWLFRLVFGRVLNPALQVHVQRPNQRPADADGQRPRRADSLLDKRNAERAISGGAAALEPSNETLAAHVISDVESTMVADVEAWLQGISSADDATVDSGPSALIEPPSPSSATRSDTPPAPPISADERPADVHPEPRPQRPISARRARRSARRVDYTKAVTDYFQQRLRDGAEPDEITGPQAAEATGASEQHARNVLRQLRQNRTN